MAYIGFFIRTTRVSNPLFVNARPRGDFLRQNTTTGIRSQSFTEYISLPNLCYSCAKLAIAGFEPETFQLQGERYPATNYKFIKVVYFKRCIIKDLNISFLYSLAKGIFSYFI